MQTTVADVAKRTGLSKQTIRNYADRGLIKTRRDGRNYRIICEPAKAIQLIEAINSGEISLIAKE